MLTEIKNLIDCAIRYTIHGSQSMAMYLAMYTVYLSMYAPSCIHSDVITCGDRVNKKFLVNLYGVGLPFN